MPVRALSCRYTSFFAMRCSPFSCLVHLSYKGGSKLSIFREIATVPPGDSLTAAPELSGPWQRPRGSAREYRQLCACHYARPPPQNLIAEDQRWDDCRGNWRKALRSAFSPLCSRKVAS